MKTLRIIVIVLLVMGMLFVDVNSALAFPPLPSSFYGMVKVNGVNVPPGMVITAKINGVQYAYTMVGTYQGNTIYSLDVPGDQSDTPVIEGGVEGDTIVFFIGTIQATQTGIWHGGTNVNLNLTGTSVEPLLFTMFLPLILR
jgi:hypothetical protein